MRNRIKTALAFLRDGKPFKVDDIRLSIHESGDVEVAGWSHFINIENLTKANSLQELDEVKSLFFEMMEVSDELTSFIQGKEIVYSLYYDDYGKGSITICSEKNGVLKWGLEFR